MTTATTTESTVVELPARELGATLSNASLFALSGPEAKVRPTLACVHLVLSDGTLSATGTDSYGLLTDEMACDVDGASFDVLLNSAGLGPVARVLLRASGMVTVQVVPGESVTFTVDGTEIAVPVITGYFPPIANLFPATTAEVSQIGLSPVLLAKLAKLVIPGRKRSDVPLGGTFTFAGSRKPVTVTFTERPGLRCLIMPRTA